jgi:hypothetical protein
MINHKQTNSLTTFWELLIYTETRLQENKLTEHLAPPVTKHIDGFHPLHKEELEAARQTRRVEAQVADANMELDASLTELHNALLGEVKQDRSAPAFTRMFPNPLSEQVRFGLAQQLEVQRAALRTLEGADNLYSAALIKEHAPHVKAAIRKAEAAISARQDNEVKLANLRARLHDWKSDANVVLTAVKAELEKIASVNKKLGGKKWVKSFFLG